MRALRPGFVATVPTKSQLSIVPGQLRCRSDLQRGRLMRRNLNDRPIAAVRSRSVRAVPIVAAAFVTVGLMGPFASTEASVSTSSVDPIESVPVAMNWAGVWIDVTAEAIGETAEWTNKVELADIDADDDVDLLFANGGDYETPGTPELSRVFLNDGDGTFIEATAAVFGDSPLLTRVIKVGDLDGDGNVDIVVGTTYDTQSRLLLGDGSGEFSDVTATNLPSADLSAGDLEIGDVDGDEDLDIVIADWGDGSPFGAGGLVTLWLNDGAAVFTDATAAQMPQHWSGSVGISSWSMSTTTGISTLPRRARTVRAVCCTSTTELATSSTPPPMRCRRSPTTTSSPRSILTATGSWTW